jgi:hypothetical protein
MAWLSAGCERLAPGSRASPRRRGNDVDRQRAGGQRHPVRTRKAASAIDIATCIGCSGHLECEAVCPKQISADWISWMARETRAGPS